jgi:hypothetical protein
MPTENRTGVLTMPTTEQETATLPNSIAQGDRSNRFWLSSKDGTSTLSLADDIYQKCFLMGQVETAIERTRTQRSQFERECQELVELLEAWKEQHSDRIIGERTKISQKPSMSVSGHIRFRFFVVQSLPGAQLDNELDAILDQLDDSVLKNNGFTMIRLDSFLVPNAE